MSTFRYRIFSTDFAGIIKGDEKLSQIKEFAVCNLGKPPNQPVKTLSRGYVIRNQIYTEVRVTKLDEVNIDGPWTFN